MKLCLLDTMISVIIPNKNGRAIRTNLSNQTLKDYELIVIEDKELRGQSWALNRGIDQAKGEYLMFLDDDLDLEPTLLEDLHNAIKDTDHSIAYCNFNKKGELNGIHRASKWNYEQLKGGNYISNCSMIKGRHFFDESIKRLKDWDLWLTMAEQGLTGIWVDKVLFTAHYDKDGISVSEGLKEAEDIIKKKHENTSNNTNTE